MARTRTEIAQDKILDVMRVLYEDDDLIGHDIAMEQRWQLRRILFDLGHVNRQREEEAMRLTRSVRTKL